MNCTGCSQKTCRTSQSCGAENFTPAAMLEGYHEGNTQQIIRAAASLVDGGLAGKLSRVQETIAFIKKMDYKKVGMAYCYGMEKEARLLTRLFKTAGIPLRTVSCTIGGINQDEINSESCIEKVSCNPLGQASQLNSEGVDFVIIMGICLGHDIILHKALNADFTTLAVKDRVNGHAPLLALENENA